jgi:hypothetical protein
MNIPKPTLWAENFLKVDLWEKQREVLNSTFVNPRTVVPAGHGVGKTFVAAIAALAFLHLYRPSIVLTTAPTWRQVKSILWAEIRHLFKERILPLKPPGQSYDTRIQFSDKWFAMGLSTNEPERFQGFHEKNILVIVDEAPGVSEPIHEAIESVLTTQNAHCLMIGNPLARSGTFFSACRSPAEWNKIKISCWDSPNVKKGEILYPKLVTRTWVREKETKWGYGSSLYMSKVEGEFPTKDDESVIPFVWVEAAVRRYELAKEKEEKGQEQQDGDNNDIRAGLDVARYGDDTTVFALVQQNRLIDLQEFTKQDTMVTAGRASQIIERIEPISFSIDDAGLGGGVTDRLRELDLSVNPVNSASRARESSKFVNRRAEMWWNAREWIKERGEIPNNPKLVEELSVPRYMIKSDGRIQIESKDSIKTRLKRSPNLADALILALEGSPSSQIAWAELVGKHI